MEKRDSRVSRKAASKIGGALTRARGEKISAVEGLTLTPRMRAVLDLTQGKSGDERRRLIREQFAKSR